MTEYRRILLDGASVQVVRANGRVDLIVTGAWSAENVPVRTSPRPFCFIDWRLP